MEVCLNGSELDCYYKYKFYSTSLYILYEVLLNNRVLLSKALLCDRLPKEIWCSQQMFKPKNIVGGLIWRLNIKFSEGTYKPRPEIEGLYCFYCTKLNFEWKLPKTGTMRWKAPAEERHCRVTWSISTYGSMPKFSIVL